MKADTLRYIPLGGVATTANKNLHIYETNNDIVLVDCGVGFPEAGQLGVDVVIPDIKYLSDKLYKIRAIIVTHAHFDHYGALPYLLKDLGRPPIYTAKLPRGFIQKDLAEKKLLKGQSIHLVDPKKDTLELGDFKITPYHINHSVPDAMGLFMETPAGAIVHNTDFKFDWTPVDEKPFEIGKLAALSRGQPQQILCLMSDCLGAAREGYTMSERYIQQAFEREIEDASRQVFITTISSNISRIQQAINVAIKYKRKVIPLGRSVDQNMEVARKLGYIETPKGVIVAADKAHRIKPHKRLYVTAGSFGQQGSALSKLAHKENRHAKVKQGDLVIFSADPIPGVYDKVARIIDQLTDAGAKVVYSELAEDLHTSGHGSQGDLSMLAGIVQPKYFVPIGGTSQHMRAYSNLVGKMGFGQDRVFELHEGEILEFDNRKASPAGRVKTRNIFVDGSRVGDVGRIVLENRQQMAEEGIFVVIVKKQPDGSLDPKVKVTSRGFVFMAESKKLIREAEKIAADTIKGNHIKHWPKVRKELENRLDNFFYGEIRRGPIILPVIVET